MIEKEMTQLNLNVKASVIFALLESGRDRDIVV